jgi:hypothetical protein
VRAFLLALALGFACAAWSRDALAQAAGSAAPAASPAGKSDPLAVSLAESTLQKMGGRDAWQRARVIEWRFFGKRHHFWDQETGDVRIEADSTLILMNLNTKAGRAWTAGNPITDPAALRETLDDGYAMWVNDSYWLVMPYKLLDPGVTLAYGGESPMADGRPAQKITMTFEGVGLTPQNKYDVWIGQETALVEQWAYYETAADTAPKFTLPWAGWKKFGPILLATEHGRDADWAIAVHEARPAGVFDQP